MFNVEKTPAEMHTKIKKTFLNTILTKIQSKTQFKTQSLESKKTKENTEVKFNLSFADLNDELIFDQAISEKLWSSNAEK